ncbi:MAG TPA: glycosyltransferase family 4 protein [Pyrinomonadaceae bacterium]|nr:glycosyltransferase family 4 protein [Pyrinomonadaceae bacterium]
MKIALLNLSGDPNRAQEELQRRYPDSIVEAINRDEFQSASAAQRVRTVRALGPDVFAVATERLVWQRGQNAFLFLGALASAKQSVIVDMYGGWREEAKLHALAHAPARLAREFTTSRAALKRAAAELKRLEAAIDRGEHRQADLQPVENPKIVYLRASPGPGTQAGGASSHINGFVNAVRALGVNISLISNDEIAGMESAPLKIIWPTPIGSSRAAFDIYNNLLFTAAAIRELEQQSPDFIYQRYARFSWAGVAAAMHTKRPLFLEFNGSEVWVGQHWDRVDKLDLLARYESLNLKAAARIFVVSQVERTTLLNAGIAAERIIVNPNGADVEKFRPQIGGDEARRELGVAPDETLVGFVGTFGPWHGVEVLAEAIRHVPRDARIRFLLIGSGALRGRVEEMLRDADLLDRVNMKGVVEHDEVPRLLDACDILVSPHVPLTAGREFFGSPTKLFEYMAMGKAIVASRLGQIADVLSDEKTALLVEPGNVRELSGAIMKLAESPNLREQLGAAARQAAMRGHTWAHNAARVLDAYQSLRNDN